MPLVNRTSKALSMWLSPAYGAPLSLRPDLNQVEALASERDALWARLDKATFLTPNEKRTAAGYPSHEGGDELKYDPAQPRVPAGQPSGGRWGPGGGGAGSGLAAIIEEIESDGRLQQVAYQGEFHDKVRDELVRKLREVGNVVETEVKLILPGNPPVAARLDILGRNAKGELLGIEVKTGENPTYATEQMIVYPHAVGGVGVISPDSKVRSLGLEPGKPLPAIEITTLYAQGPGSRLIPIPVPAVPLPKQ